MPKNIQRKKQRNDSMCSSEPKLRNEFCGTSSSLWWAQFSQLTNKRTATTVLRPPSFPESKLKFMHVIRGCLLTAVDHSMNLRWWQIVDRRSPNCFYPLFVWWMRWAAISTQFDKISVLCLQLNLGDTARCRVFKSRNEKWMDQWDDM